MNIKVELDKISDALNIFNHEIISQELDDYIVYSCEHAFFKKENISLTIYGIDNKEDQEKLEKIVHSYYKNRYAFYKKVDKYDDYFRIIFLFLGIIAIIFSENFVSFLSELFLIAGWVVIWEIIYDVIFKDIKRRRRANIYKKLTKSRIIFK